MTGVEKKVACLCVAALCARMKGVEVNIACVYAAAFECSKVDQSKRSNCKRSATKRGNTRLRLRFNLNPGDL